MVLQNHLLFLCFTKFQDFTNFYIPLINKKQGDVFRTNSSSQTSQDQFAVCDIVKLRGKRMK